MEEPAEEDFIDATLNWRVQLKRDNGMLFYTYTDRATGEQIRGAAPLSAEHEQLKRLEKYTAQQDRQGIPDKELRDALRIVYPELGANGLVLPYGPLPALKLAFFTYFRVPLSEEALATRRRGVACGNFWTITYLFEKDKWGGTFLECYASNLFTDERWIRIDENGTVTTLGTGAEWELDDDSLLDLRDRVKARGLYDAGTESEAPENPYYFQYDAPFKASAQRAGKVEPESPVAFTNDHLMASSWRLLNFNVAGFHHHAGPALIATMRPGDNLTLVAEPDNTYDRQPCGWITEA